MKRKECLQTIRLSREEWREVGKFLKSNQVFETFSSLARIAINEFIREKRALSIKPVSSYPKKRPYFLWDYNLTEGEVLEILSQPSLAKKKWLIARILEHCFFRDVWRYLTLDEIREALPSLRMSPRKKERWRYAIELWNQK